MFVRQERIALILLLAVALVLSLSYIALESLGKHYFAEEYRNDIPDGTLVYHSGRVTEASRTANGGHLLVRIDGVAVFAPGSIVGITTPVVGDMVEVTGTVQTYQGEKEIVIESSRDITLLPAMSGSAGI